MGILTNCCSGQSSVQSSISIYSFSERDIFKINENEIPTIFDINHALKYITSKDYYSLLFRNIPKHIISQKICLKLNNNDIIILIKNLYDWIQKVDFDNDEITKKSISIIKENTQISLKYILKEVGCIKFKEKIEIYILQSLSCISLIIQCILFLYNYKNNENHEYKFNIWKNKNIIEEAKKYGFQAAYFLILIKNKYNEGSNNNLINSNEDNKITRDTKEKINSFYKISLDFASNIISCQ